jgi:hypothetical protein
MNLSFTDERRADLEALQAQLPTLTNPRARKRTERAIQRLELELAPGKAREAQVLR